jgi:alkanesulfonate monooxygenase SsuD/methylene tetrahydromethanopterin reductase-like flavin-dependent oxidoreductase (luciferase family)
MRFGLFSEFELGKGTYDHVTGLYDDYLRQSCYAEEHGFDSVWILEHHFTDLYSYCSAPEMLLAALAARTSKIRLGCGVCLLPYHNPVTVAERYATLDHLCHGRLEFGIGRGTAFEWNKFRAEPFEQGRDIMYEALDVVLKCWTREEFVHEGPYYSIKSPINVIPKPMQKPHPPIHAAISTPESADIYGEKGFEALGISRVHSAAEIQRQAQHFRSARARSHPTAGQGKVSVLADIHCAPTDREADERFSRYHKWFFTWMGRTYFPDLKPADVANSDNLFARYIAGAAGFDDFKRNGMVISGSPETCVKALEFYREAGVDCVMCQFKLGLMSNEETMASMELFTKEVVPAFTA